MRIYTRNKLVVLGNIAYPKPANIPVELWRHRRCIRAGVKVKERKRESEGEEIQTRRRVLRGSS